jgi:hypothetical protein
MCMLHHNAFFVSRYCDHVFCINEFHVRYFYRYVSFCSLFGKHVHCHELCPGLLLTTFHAVVSALVTVL